MNHAASPSWWWSIRHVLKICLVTLLCFALIGTFLLMMYISAHGVVTDTWSADETSLPLKMLLIPLGTLLYFPIVAIYGGMPMLVAALLYISFRLVFGAILDRWIWAVLAGIVAAKVSAIVNLEPELLLTPRVWLAFCLGYVIAGVASALITAWILRRVIAAPAHSATAHDGDLRRPRPTVRFAAAAFAAVLAAVAVMFALKESVAREDVVYLHREAAAAAHAFRRAAPAEQARLVGDLMQLPDAKSSIAERLQPSGGPVVRPIRDREQLAAELATLRARAPTVTSLRYNVFDDTIETVPKRSSMLFVEERGNLVSNESIRYVLRGREVVMTSYNFSLTGGGKDTTYSSLLIGQP
ncbi:MAG: hypothetical protein ABI537_16725 [Casimicrobiaceae bacterium]